MSSHFCTECTRDAEVDIEERRESLTVRGDEFEVPTRVAVCRECGEDVWVDEFEDEALEKAFALYREKHGLLSPDEIEAIRKRWGLGQRAFSLLLGWGEITLHRYESGSVQDGAHDAQLRMAENAENVRILLEANGDRLGVRQRATIEKRLAAVDEAEGDCGGDDLERLPARESSGAYGGDRPLSMAKLREMVAFFCESGDVFVTKLAKLLFYADFLHHKEHTVSITGLAYAHLTYGPVPEHYERIRADLIEGSVVEVDERTGRDWAGEVLTATRPADRSVFDPGELAVMEFVRDTLSRRTSKELSEMSHKESAYISTEMDRRIPYGRAKELSLSLDR